MGRRGRSSESSRKVESLQRDSIVIVFPKKIQLQVDPTKTSDTSSFHFLKQLRLFERERTHSEVLELGEQKPDKRYQRRAKMTRVGFW